MQLTGSRQRVGAARAGAKPAPAGLHRSVLVRQHVAATPAQQPAAPGGRAASRSGSKCRVMSPEAPAAEAEVVPAAEPLPFVPAPAHMPYPERLPLHQVRRGSRTPAPHRPIPAAQAALRGRGRRAQPPGAAAGRSRRARPGGRSRRAQPPAPCRAAAAARRGRRRRPLRAPRGAASPRPPPRGSRRRAARLARAPGCSPAPLPHLPHLRHPLQAPMGLTFYQDGSATFRVWAPHATSVSLLLSNHLVAPSKATPRPDPNAVRAPPC
jgi:hypothetical protein